MKSIQSLRIPSILFLASLLFGVACEKKGPMEKAGEKMDDKMEDVGDKIEDATN